MTTKNTFTTKSSNITVPLPLFIPVYRPDYSFELFSEDSRKYGLSAVMVNAFLLFRERRLKAAFEQGHTLRNHIGGFDGMLCTDSGAFQQLSGRKVGVDPLEIVKFQNMIKTDIAAPLDLITPPDTGFDETRRRMIISQYRIAEALEVCDYSDLAGIQQGGGFFSLRQKHIRQLAGIGIKYYGIGSMVPFFNKNHDLSFTCGVIRDARSVIGEGAPMHVYGAGDPLDIAFMFFAGANIFDSSSYAHYAQRGYYMTPYGAVNKRSACERLGFECACPVCRDNEPAGIFDIIPGEPLRKLHNLFLILETVRALGEFSGNTRIEEYVSVVYDRHIENIDLFPGSMLASSWEKYLKGDKSDKEAETGKAMRFIDPDTEGGGDDFCCFGQFRDKTGIPSIEKPSLPHLKGLDADNCGREPKTIELSEIEQEAIEVLAAESAVVYKMDRSVIAALLAEELTAPKNTRFRSRINGAESIKEAQRLSEYKTFRKNMRAVLYQKLRQYKEPDLSANELLAGFVECAGSDIASTVDSLLRTHVSTRERMPDREEFARTVHGFIKPGDAVIDVGCGFAPLLWPAGFFENLSCYIAVDKDAEATETVRVFAKKCGITNLKAFTWDINSGLPELNRLTGIDRYDIALMLKLIPVVSRADQASGGAAGATSILGDFPAARLLATVNRESMTKRESIEKRELSVLKQFIRAFDFSIEAGFSGGSETGYCIVKKLTQQSNIW